MQADRYEKRTGALQPKEPTAELTEPAGPPAPPDWRHRYALGLPEGSVRALLALILFGTIWSLLTLRPDQPLPGYLRDLLFIILGHYFATRKRKAEGPTVGPPPLFLPRGSVRLILIGGFIGVAYWLGRRGHLANFPNNSAGLTLLLVGGFLMGVVLNRLKELFLGEARKSHRWFEDLKAMVVLATSVLLVLLIWEPALPEGLASAMERFRTATGITEPEEILAAVIGFYFGTRS